MINWPDKKVTFNDETYKNGWNACYDAFMKVIESQPTGLVPLNEKLVDKIVADCCLSSGDHGESYDADKIVKDICSNFGQQPQRDIPYSNEIYKIIENFKSEETYQIPNYQYEELAQAIHDLISGGDK